MLRITYTPVVHLEGAKIIKTIEYTLRGMPKDFAFQDYKDRYNIDDLNRMTFNEIIKDIVATDRGRNSPIYKYTRNDKDCIEFLLSEEGQKMEKERLTGLISQHEKDIQYLKDMLETMQ